MPVLNTADLIILGRRTAYRVCLGDKIVWELKLRPGEQPSILNVTSNGTAFVAWNASLGADSYFVYRNGIFIQEVTDTRFEDSGLSWGASYVYTVAPVNSNGVVGSESPTSVPAVIPYGKVEVLSASNRSYTNVTVSWAAVPGADSYEVYVQGVAQGVQTSLSRNVAMAADQTKTIYVVPIRASVRGTASRTYSYYSGKQEQRDIGAVNDLEFMPAIIDSYRSVDAWAYLSNTAAQGTYGTYGSYSGVIHYGSGGVRDALAARLGSMERAVYGSCTKCYVYLYKKTGVGSNGSITIGFYLTNSPASGGAPSGALGRSRASSSSGVGQWYDVGTDYGQHLGTGSHSGIMINYDGKTNYAQFSGNGTGKLSLNWSWNFLKVAAVPNSWS